MKRKLLLALLAIPAIAISAHKGTVFIDQNQNGTFDKGEKPLSEVMVTDGLNVVKSNAKGEFTLAGHDRERFITVTTPSGYRIHKHYIRIDKDRKTYDFGLIPYTENIAPNGEHQFIQIADTEIFNTSDQARWVNNIRNYATNQNVAFIIHTGDICYPKGLKKHIELMNSENMGIPMYYILGNHDLTAGDYGEQLFEEIYGPVWFSFDFGNVHYIVTPMLIGDKKPSYTQADIYAWLKNDLAHIDKEKPVILFNHTLETFPGFEVRKNENEKIDLKEYNLKALLHGHWHLHNVQMLGKVKVISTACPDKGGVDHSTTAYRLASIDGSGNIATQLRYTYMDNHLEIASIKNNAACYTADRKVPLSVNTYNSNALTDGVSYTLRTRKKTIAQDIDLKQNTDWNWSAEMAIADQYRNQQLFVDVTTRFSNGEVAKKTEGFLFNPDNRIAVDTTHTGEHNGNFAFPLQLSWVTNLKSNLFFTSPVVYRNMVYVASVDEDLKGEAFVFALDIETGALKWKFKAKNSIKSSIAAANGQIFAQDVEGHLYALDAGTGTLNWEKQLEKDPLPSLCEGLIATDSVVYAGNMKGLSAYDTATGRQLWKNSDWNQGLSSPFTLSANNDIVIAGTQWGGLFTHDAKTGKMLWSTKKGVSNRGGSPAIHGDLAYFGSLRSLFVMDIRSGEIIREVPLDLNVDAMGTPLVTEELIIQPTITGGLVALHKETFEKVWTLATNTALVFTGPYTRHPFGSVETSPVRIGDKIIFGASDGILYAADLKTGLVDWQHEAGAPIFSAVAVSGNTLFVTDFGGNVYGFSSGRYDSPDII